MYAMKLPTTISAKMSPRALPHCQDKMLTVRFWVKTTTWFENVVGIEFEYKKAWLNSIIKLMIYMLTDDCFQIPWIETKFMSDRSKLSGCQVRVESMLQRSTRRTYASQWYADDFRISLLLLSLCGTEIRPGNSNKILSKRWICRWKFNLSTPKMTH
jgi:hypothetical protein